MARRDGIFPGESRLTGGDGKVKVYRMEFPDGWGTMTAHAVMDAVLGAAALGDIGSHFPPSDPKWKGADSRKLLAEVVKLVHAEGFDVVNADMTVVAERPKIGPHVAAMRFTISWLLDVPVESVSVKAKTNEKMDAVGREEGMAAYAVVLLAARS